jgi:hypothetical protein
MNKGGRPLKFKSVDELKDKIEAYFLSIQDEDGNYIKPPTVTGLAVALNTSRETLCNYEEKEEYFDAIKDAKARCEAWVEENALVGKANATFSIFNLKNNYKWKDKTESDITSGGEPLKGNTIVIQDFSDNIQDEADSK